MLGARAIVSVAAAVSIVCGAAGIAVAQQPAPEPTTPTRPPTPTVPTPAQPTPVPPPTGTPTPTKPPAKEKEEEPQPPPAERAGAPLRVPEDFRTPAPGTVTPRVFVGPDLFNPPAPQGWLTLTPSFTLSAEYNDNIFLDGRNRESDVILAFTPSVTLSMQRPGFKLSGGYSVSGQVFIDNNDLSDFGKEQQFYGDLSYQLSPRLSLSIRDDFVYSRDSNTVTSGGVSVGLNDTWRNTFTPRLRFDATQNTTLSLLASYSVLRFQGGEDLSESDTYRVALGADHRLTQRLTGVAELGVAFFDPLHESSAWTYTPRVGFSYDITPTLRATVLGGPSITERDGDTTITPSIMATATQTLKYGSIQVGYDRAVAAETIGLSDSHVVFATLLLPTLYRGLLLEFTPRYSIVDTVGGGNNGSNETVRTLTLNLGATYQIARNINIIGSYTFFRQTTDANVPDIDQNRVFLGVQYAFPINFY